MVEKLGVITGCDARQEWMLKGFWNAYRAHNDFPVIFFDYGMSMSARKWCEKRARVVPFSPLALSVRPFHFPSSWPEMMVDYFTNRREVWFAKAFSLAKSPYDKNVWIDLDCEVRGPIDPLFDMCENESGFAITHDLKETTERFREDNILSQTAEGYQVGVFSFKRKSIVIQKWLEHCTEHQDKELSEQTSLDHMLDRENLDIAIFSTRYNWIYRDDFHLEEAVIVHYPGILRKHKLLAIGI